MTDKQRLKTIKVILFILDHPEHVDQGGKTQTLINRTKNYKNINENSMSDERIFAISGQDIYECGYQWSCGTLAKAFYYVNSNLLNILQKMPDEKKGALEQEVGSLEDVEPLEEVKIMISIHPDHLIDAMSAHTLPCIKMDDGKWHAIEPNIEYTVDEYKSCPIIPGEVRVGNKIHHILKTILKEGGKPYEITKIMTGAEYEEQGLKEFLQTASKRDKQTKLIIGKIETVLRQINNGKSVGRAYSFCKVLEDDTLNIKILILKNDDHNFTTVAVRIKNNWYHFNPANTYVGLYWLKKMGKDKFVNLPSGTEYTIIAEYTPEEYIKYYEESVKQNKGNSYGKVF